MIYIRHYNNLKKYIDNHKEKPERIDYKQFEGKVVYVYTQSGNYFKGMLIRTAGHYIELIMRPGNRHPARAYIIKSCVVAVSYQYM